MKLEELPALYAAIAARWPRFEPETITPAVNGAYAEDMRDVSLDEAIAGVRLWAAEGKSSAPNGGQIAKMARQANPRLAEPREYEGPKCTCHTKPGFPGCKVMHTERYINARKREIEAMRIVKEHRERGVEPQPSRYPGLEQEVAVMMLRHSYDLIGDPRDHYADPDFDLHAWRARRDAALAAQTP